ncbi:MAG: hypothetical protein NC084_04055 [Bacteroides sp.]|nr:deoxyuridine 5'-triphosphate nucleotidohydrolase [Eubacterium sp.]MCM1417661.1 deoxyuridine 5'-triphosphate nucleotidohydrolase [Roseburia sp.]MCM1461874.1 hypothetical protein [Bacteroides sp.]
MNKIATFEKVSFNQFLKGWKDTFPESTEDKIRRIYDSIRLPQRATKGSAGYDFFAPCDVELGNSIVRLVNFLHYGRNNINDYIITIPTGIRCEIENGWVLQLYPRSGHGFKYGVRLADTVGIIDSDYYDSDNEGHIFVKLVNDSAIEKYMVIKTGEAFCQGVFVPFGVTTDDHVEGIRNGGFGSTG